MKNMGLKVPTCWSLILAYAEPQSSSALMHSELELAALSSEICLQPLPERLRQGMSTLILSCFARCA